MQNDVLMFRVPMLRSKYQIQFGFCRSRSETLYSEKPVCNFESALASVPLLFLVRAHLLYETTVTLLRSTVRIDEYKGIFDVSTHHVSRYSTISTLYITRRRMSRAVRYRLSQRERPSTYLRSGNQAAFLSRLFEVSWSSGVALGNRNEELRCRLSQIERMPMGRQSRVGRESSARKTVSRLHRGRWMSRSGYPVS